MRELKILSKRRYFYPGEVVRLTAGLKTDKPLKIRGGKLAVKGEEICREGRGPSFGSGFNPDLPDYSDDKVCVDILDLEKTISGPRTFPPGKHKIPFSFRLPEDALPSYGGWRASTSYAMELRLDVPLGLDLKGSHYFKVVYHPDDIHALARPVSGVSPGYLPYAAGPGYPPALIVELDSNVFFAGGEIEGRVRARNIVPYQVTKLSVRLESVQRALGESNTEGKVEQGLESWELQENIPLPFSLQIPHDAETTTKGKNCSCDWSLVVLLETRPFFPGVLVRLPIAIYQWDQDDVEE